MKSDFFKKQNKVIFSIIIGFIILVGLLYYLVHFLMGKILIEKNSFEREKFGLEYLIKEGNKLDKYQDLSEKMNENQMAIENAIIGKEEQIKLIESLEGVASDLNVYIKKQSYTPPKKKKITQEEAVAPSENSSAATQDQTAQQSSQQQEESSKNKSYLMVTFIGSYENLLKFIYKVENLEHAVEIQSLKASVLDSLDIRRLENDLSQSQGLLVGAELEADILLSFNPL